MRLKMQSILLIVIISLRILGHCYWLAVQSAFTQGLCCNQLALLRCLRSLRCHSRRVLLRLLSVSKIMSRRYHSKLTTFAM